MIDLGIELANYTGELPQRPDGATIPRIRQRGVGVSIRLADLQAQGFNTEPPPGIIWKTSNL